MSDRVTKSTIPTRNFFPLGGMARSLQQRILQDLYGFWPSAALSAPKMFPLVRQHLGYSSPFACQVARHAAIAPADLARQLAAYLTPYRSVRAKPNGWLEFDLLPAELVRWLSAIEAQTRGAGIPAGVPVLPAGAGVGLHQYAHARCHTWLLLGRETGLLNVATDPEILWERLLAETLPSQVALLGVLLDFGDRAADRTAPNAGLAPEAFDEAAVLQLAAATLAFLEDCPLWGERCRQDRTLARAQLGLVAIACGVLAWLLEVCLELPAPQSL